ncbi:MAG: TlpA disulfide reductase family protein [Planctomycetota bacterium]|nr:TlpA disulfide reductase family protein [Planctomycetota bacterium]
MNSIRRLIVVCAAVFTSSAMVFAQDVTLKAGSAAPSLEGLEIVSGDPELLNAALDAKVTVVEFWATWCPPCKAAIPHLNELYKQLKPQGLLILGVSTDKTRPPVDEFVRAKGDSMSYLVGWDKDEAIASRWMKAAGKSGIPCSMIVANKRIVWIGNPHDKKFDEIIRLTMSGRYDPILTPKSEPSIAAARKAANVGNFKQAYNHLDEVIALDPKVMFDAALLKYRILLDQEHNAAGAQAWAQKMIEDYGGESSELSEFAVFLASAPDLSSRDLDTAKKAAEAAVEASSSVESAPLAALARVQFLKGDVTAAYATQRKAFQLASPESKSLYKTDLDAYKAAAARAKASVGG